MPTLKRIDPPRALDLPSSGSPIRARGRWSSAFLACALLAPPALARADSPPTLDFLNNVGIPPCMPGAFAMMAQGVDASVYIAGYDAYGSACLMHFSADGHPLWFAPVTGSQSYIEVAGLSVDAAGNAYVSITDGDGYPGTAFLVKYGPGGAQMQSVQMPIPAGVGTTFGAGTVFDRARGIVYAAEYYGAPNGPTALIAAYTPALSQTAKKTMLGFTEASASADSAGNVYLGGSEAGATGWVYRAAKFSPGLASMSWTATMPFPVTRFSRETNTADFNGGMVFLGLERGSGLRPAYVLRRVTAGSGIGASASVPNALIGYTLSTDPQSAVYMRGYDSRGTLGLLKVAASGTLAWGLSDGCSRFMQLGAPAKGGKVYTYGYDEISQPHTAYLARYSQGGGQQLKIVLGAPTVSPASPPTIPRVALAGNPNTSVEIDLVDSAGNPVAQQTAINVSVSETAFSGGHAHDNARPVGSLSGTGITAGSSVSGTTDANGKLFLVYTSTTVGGQEKITATLASDASVSTSAVVTVAVVDRDGSQLFDMSTLPNSYMQLTGGTGTTSYPPCLGHALEHPSNHWATRGTVARVISAIGEFYDTTHIKLRVNDMSLADGGLLDICGDWQLTTYYSPKLKRTDVKGHKCHRGGNSIDIGRSNLTEEQILRLTTIMNGAGGEAVNEGPIHFQFPGLETCYGTGG